MSESNYSKIRVEILSQTASWRRVRGLSAQLKEAAAKTVSMLPSGLRKTAKNASVTLLLTTDKEMRRLNHDFRGLNKPTNVLSFPQHSRRQLAALSKRKAQIYIGDIAIAYRYTAKEARKDHKTLKNHVTHLLIHGLLHLFGYDHHTRTATIQMERLEKKIMATMGLPDPYLPFSKQSKRRFGRS